MGDIVSTLRVMLDGLSVLIEHVSASLPGGELDEIKAKLATLEERVSTLEGKLK
jgi:hypothetical protein